VQARLRRGALQGSLAHCEKSARLRRRRLQLLILCLALFAGSTAEAGPGLAAAQQSAAGAAGVNFAIADFDGDSLPDLATVQPGLAMASRTSYWIHFQFSLGNQGSFAVSGPTGGLQIASRDVNGDSFLDLIISTSIGNDPVAVLLNDGRGNFRMADSRAFSAAIWGALTEWRASAANWEGEGLAMASAGWAGVICSMGTGGELPAALGQVARPCEKSDGCNAPHEVRGRAPPAA
jgi:hypothetical protein